MLYIIYDPSLNGLPGLIALQHLYPVHRSLFHGTKDEMLQDVAPYLFAIDESFTEQTRNLHIPLDGVLVVDSDEELEKLFNHFQRFIYQTINKRKYYFRFWDSRVLIRFLPSCEESQLIMFFDGVKNFTVKSDHGVKQFRFTPFGLQTARTGLGAPGLIFGIVPEGTEEMIA